MRSALVILWLLIPLSCIAEEVESGNYIVVRGAVKGCEAWNDRILDIVEVKFEKPATVLEFDDVPVLGKDMSEIRIWVLDAVEESTGVRPQSLTFELITSVLDIKPLIDAYLFSTKWLYAGHCPPQYERREERNIRIEEEMEKLRREEFLRSVVKLYNKSFRAGAVNATA